MFCYILLSDFYIYVIKKTTKKLKFKTKLALTRDTNYNCTNKSTCEHFTVHHFCIFIISCIYYIYIYIKKRLNL